MTEKMRRGTGEKPGSSIGAPHIAAEDDPTGKRKQERRVLRAFASPQQTRCTFLFVFVTLVCTYLIIIGSDRLGSSAAMNQEKVLMHHLQPFLTEDESFEGRFASAGLVGGQNRKAPVSGRGFVTGRRWLSLFKNPNVKRLETPYVNLRIFVYDIPTVEDSKQRIELVSGVKLESHREAGTVIKELIRKSNVYTPFPQLADFYVVTVKLFTLKCAVDENSSSQGCFVLPPLAPTVTVSTCMFGRRK